MKMQNKTSSLSTLGKVQVVFFITSVFGYSCFAQTIKTYELTSKDGRTIKASVQFVDSHVAKIVRESDGKEFTLKLTQFDRETVILLGGIRQGQKLNRDLYPYSRLEIRERIRQIKTNANRQKEYSSEQRRALERLNTYRFLCGLPSDMILDPKFVASASNAAKTCDEKEKMSHGHNEDTRICNLGYAGRKPPLSEFIDGWINDGGKISNRRTRGHRLECFSAAATKLGIAKCGKFAAMCVSPRDYYNTGVELPRFFTFPGRGYYPASMINLMRNTGWSVLFNWQKVLIDAGIPESEHRKTKNRLPNKSEISVRVFKISKRLEHLPEKGTVPPNSTEIEIKMLSAGRGHKTEYIHFEPQMEAKPGAKYWVIIQCSHFETEYLVHFF